MTPPKTITMFGIRCRYDADWPRIFGDDSHSWKGARRDEHVRIQFCEGASGIDRWNVSYGFGDAETDRRRIERVRRLPAEHYEASIEGSGATLRDAVADFVCAYTALLLRTEQLPLFVSVNELKRVADACGEE